MNILVNILLTVTVIALTCMFIPAAPLAWYSWLGIAIVAFITGVSIKASLEEEQER